MLTLFLMFSCAKEPAATEASPPPAVQEAPAAEAPAAAEENAAKDDKPAFMKQTFVDPLKDPAGAYAQCKERVEGPETAGECSTDADCAKAGCSKEVCVSTATAADFNTTCDTQACFRALDSCGCVEGVCSWTLIESEAG